MIYSWPVTVIVATEICTPQIILNDVRLNKDQGSCDLKTAILILKLLNVQQYFFKPIICKYRLIN